MVRGQRRRGRRGRNHHQQKLLLSTSHQGSTLKTGVTCTSLESQVEIQSVSHPPHTNGTHQW